MKRITWLGGGLLGLALSLPGCCTDEAYASLRITVLDASGKLACDAEVTARDGSYSTKLAPMMTGCAPYVGPVERPGTYEVTVTRPGRASVTLNATVKQNSCHVETEYLTVTIQ